MKRPKIVPGLVLNWVGYANWLEAENAKLREAAQALVDTEYCNDGYMNTSVGNNEFDELKTALEPESSTITGKLHR
jgi:hypothetical protein